MVPLREVAGFEVADEASARLRSRRTPATMTREPHGDGDCDETEEYDHDEPARHRRVLRRGERIEAYERPLEELIELDGAQDPL